MSKRFLTKKASRQVCLAAGLTLVSAAVSCRQQHRQSAVAVVTPSPTVVQSLPPNSSPQLKQFVEAAVEQSKLTTGYDPSYVKLDYPNGDVPSDTGVCSDVVVRAFRKVGIDLQKEVHEDMTRAWLEYPRKWGARGTDSNIDHRRVLNLTTYFTRQGSLCRSLTSAPIICPVTWWLGNSAMVSNTSAFSPTSGLNQTNTAW
jgi:uncharacterized protein YijF (DUF1287 family)